jgi:hypothetical protein
MEEYAAERLLPGIIRLVEDLEAHPLWGRGPKFHDESLVTGPVCREFDARCAQFQRTIRDFEG